MEHFYESVPGWFWWEDIYAEAVRSAPHGEPSHFVEVGTWLGRSAVYMAVEIANADKPIRFDCVDTWLGSVNDYSRAFHDYFAAHGDDKNAAYEEFLKYIEPVKHLITPVREASVLASRLYADESLDLVFLDSDHEYSQISADIEAWYPKVKTGGTIGGDDFGNEQGGVRRAVTEFFQDFRLNSVDFCWVARK